MGLRDLFQRPRRQAGHPVEQATTASRSARLAPGGSVSVSGEEHYQEALNRLRQGAVTEATVTATLVPAPNGNPWVKSSTSPVLEVRVGDEVVGFLTKAMTNRYLPFQRQAEAAGLQLTCAATIADGTGKSGRDTEITLDAVPRWEGQDNIHGLSVEVMPDYIVERSSGFAHEIDDGMRAVCGRTFTPEEAEVVYRTKPWVGRALSDGTLVEYTEARCTTCRGPGGAVEDGGRFGDQTLISRETKFNVKMTAEAVARRLETHLDFDVAGESFCPGYPENLYRIAETIRSISGPEYLSCVLRRDPTNKHDPNAIEVYVVTEDGRVGFVPKQLARLLAPLLDSGALVNAWAVEVRVNPASPANPGLTVRLQRVGSPPPTA